VASAGIWCSQSRRTGDAQVDAVKNFWTQFGVNVVDHHMHEEGATLCARISCLPPFVTCACIGMGYGCKQRHLLNQRAPTALA